MTLMLTFQTDVKCCARCQQDHPKLEFKEIENYKFATHYALCPTNGQPVMMNVKQDGKSKGTKPVGGLPGFDRFWSLYPKKEGKVPCQRKWNKLGVLAIEAIFKALAWQIKLPKWIDGFAPMPLTYLNQERWNDLPPLLIKGPSQSQVFNTPKGPTAAEMKAGIK